MIATLDAAGLIAFRGLDRDAANAVTQRLFAMFAAEATVSGKDARQCCADDIAYQLEFLRPVLEFGTLQPLVSFLHWQESLWPQSSLAAAHIVDALQCLADFYAERLPVPHGALVRGVLEAVKESFSRPQTETESMPQVPLQPWSQTREFQAALLAGNHLDAVAVMNRSMDEGADLTDFELHVIQPTLYDIGEMWHANQVSVAQ
jgi:hypothetical protein